MLVVWLVGRYRVGHGVRHRHGGGGPGADRRKSTPLSVALDHVAKHGHDRHLRHVSACGWDHFKTCISRLGVDLANFLADDEFRGRVLALVLLEVCRF